MDLTSICEKIYEKDGMDGVIDYCNSIDHQNWAFCTQCESLNPVFEGHCLACGSGFIKEE